MKLGYKQTEVGAIPKDWEMLSLSELTEPQRPISYGIVQTGPNIINGVRCLRVLDINEGKINKAELITTSKEISDAYRRTILKAGDLVMPLRGKVGDVGLVDEDLAGANLTRGVALIAIRPGWSPEYCQQVISSSATRKRLEQAMNGSALQEIPIASLRTFKIPTPKCLDEQRAIAKALNDVDALLGAIDQLIAKKRDLKQAAMQQLLTGQTRLPGFHGKWAPLNMADNSTLKARIGWQGLTTAEYLESGPYYLVTGTDFLDGHIAWSSCHFVAAERYNQDRNIQLRPKDILLTKDGTIGKVAFVDDLPGPGTLNSGVFVIRPKNEAYDPKFFFYVLTSRIFDEFLTKLQAGSTISHLYQKDFVSFSFLAPVSVDEQAAIAEVLGDMDAELASLKERREKTRALKQGMMQELLTGWTRLISPNESHA